MGAIEPRTKAELSQMLSFRVRAQEEEKSGVKTEIKQGDRMSYFVNAQKVFQGFKIGNQYILKLLFKEMCQLRKSNKMVARADMNIILRFSFQMKEKHTGWIESL